MVMKMKTRRTVLYAGSFDPPTNGHLDLIRRALDLFDEIVVAIGIHPGKTPLFTPDERATLIKNAVDEEIGAPANVRTIFFSGLLVEEAKRQGAVAVVRGLRDSTDFDYEMQMSGMNGVLAPEITTIFLPASPHTRPITATLVRQIAKMGGDVTSFVARPVASALKDKFARLHEAPGSS